MVAVILAGGIGSRLQPLTDKLPKPLVEVQGRPIIEILLTQLKKGGVKKVYVSIGHLGSMIKKALGDGDRFGLELIYVSESEPLGTVGPLRLINDLPESFVVANGDILTDLDVNRVIKQHQESGAQLTVAACERADPIDFGVLKLDGKQLVGFEEKPLHSVTVSMGIYVFSREVLDLIPEGEPFGFDELILSMLSHKKDVRAYMHDGYWLDIGRPVDYIRANNESEKLASLFDL